jgi:pilus assembly protein CpaF
MNTPKRPNLDNHSPANATKYITAGHIDVEALITGETLQFHDLEPQVVNVVTQVQKELVDSGHAARYDRMQATSEEHNEYVTLIDRLALKNAISGHSGAGVRERQWLLARVRDDIAGLGPIEPLWQDSRITEVIMNGPADCYVERDGQLLHAKGVKFRDQSHLLDVCRKIVSPLNRKLDLKSPLVDGRLPDGSRVNVAHPAIAPQGPLLTIRRFPEVNRSLADLVDLEAMSDDMARTLAWLVAAKASTLVVGGTGTGKTTLLNALSAAIPKAERIITIEDSLELRLSPSAHVAAMEARPADAAGENGISIRALVKNALRQRPDRIIVGEVRDESALEMLQACNTGHEGSMSTVHANGPNEAVARLAVMVAQGGEFPADRVDWLVGSALDIAIMVRRYRDGSRRISGVYEIPELADCDTDQLTTIPLWEWERTGEKNNRYTGTYVKRNDISPQLTAKLGLDFEPRPTWESIVALGF